MSGVESISTKNHATISQLNCENSDQNIFGAKKAMMMRFFLTERYVVTTGHYAFLSVISTTQGTVVHPGTVMIHTPEWTTKSTAKCPHRWDGLLLDTHCHGIRFFKQRLVGGLMVGGFKV